MPVLAHQMRFGFCECQSPSVFDDCALSRCALPRPQILETRLARRTSLKILGEMGDRFLSSAGAGGNCARPVRLPDPSPVLDKNRAPMGPEIYPVLGLGSGEGSYGIPRLQFCTG